MSCSVPSRNTADVQEIMGKATILCGGHAMVISINKSISSTWKPFEVYLIIPFVDEATGMKGVTD